MCNLINTDTHTHTLQRRPFRPRVNAKARKDTIPNRFMPTIRASGMIHSIALGGVPKDPLLARERTKKTKLRCKNAVSAWLSLKCARRFSKIFPGCIFHCSCDLFPCKEMYAPFIMVLTIFTRMFTLVTPTTTTLRTKSSLRNHKSSDDVPSTNPQTLGDSSRYRAMNIRL